MPRNALERNGTPVAQDRDFTDWYSRGARVDAAILDEKARTVRTVIATEDPVLVFDWERWEPVREILLMSGAEFPKARQVPLLDTHSRWEISSVKGSVREIRVEGTELQGLTKFSATAEDAFTLVREGHLTDISAGYQVIRSESVYLAPGESTVVDGRTFTADAELGLYIRKRWILKEVSLVPIGADQRAKFRSEHHRLMDPAGVAGHRDGAHQETTSTGGGAMPQERQDPQQQTPGTPAAAATPAAPQNDAHLREVEEARVRAREEGRVAEATRQQEIRAAVELAPLAPERRAELERQCIADPTCTIDVARRKILEELGKRADSPAPVQPVAGGDEADKYHRAAVDALCLRAGVPVDDKAAAAVRQSDVPRDLHSLVRACVLRTQDGVRMALRVATMGVDDLYTEACRLFHSSRAMPVGSGDFANILLDATNKILGTAFTEEVVTYPAWCSEGEVKDFKDVSIISRSAVGDWKKILEGEPFPMGRLTDKRETGGLDTYGLQLPLPRRVIVDDDMQFFADHLAALGAGAARGINMLVYDTLTSASLAGPTMNEDSHALFDTTYHANINATSGVVSTTSLATARKYLRKLAKLAPDKTSKTQYLGADVKYVVTGVDNQTAVEQVLGSMYDPSASVGQIPNVFFGRVTPVFDPYLQTLLDAGSKSNAWYAVADKGRVPTMRILYLTGRRQPTLRRADSTVGQPLGILFDAYFDYGVIVGDWRGIVYNDGA